MPKIIDVIIHQPKEPYSAQTMLVLDKMPDFRYRREGNLLLAEDGGFYSCYFHERPTPNSKAFGGAVFDIPLLDGGVERAEGQWWCGSHPIGREMEVVQPGYNTIAGLHKCYVFTGGATVEKRLIDNWLERNEASRDYRKYEKKPPAPPALPQVWRQS